MKYQDIIDTAVKRMCEAVDWDGDNRIEAKNDLEHLAGMQWPEEVKEEREADGRPCLTINRLPQFVRQVTGDLRRLNPAIKVLPGDGDTGKEDADLIASVIRGIEYDSKASNAYEAAAESAASCGFGHFRILTEYESDNSFNQVIRIKRIHNPFAVYWDPSARESTREDANWCFITESMPKEDFEAAYPNASSVGVEVEGNTDGLENWHEDGKVIVAEYYWKEPKTKTIALMADGTVVEDPIKGMNYVKERKVEGHEVKWAKISGRDVLEKPRTIPCKYIPVVSVTGEEIYVGDELIRTSVIRFARDPQQMYNYWRSASTEMVALQPKAPFLVTANQIKGYESQWAAANDSNDPYLPYNPDNKAPGPPQRSMPPIPSQGMFQEIMQAEGDMKAVTGIYDAALGNGSNEKSGVAIRQRQMESDISTSIYSDNLAKAITHCGNILVDMIPRIYDTFRSVPVVREDDTEEVIQVNGIAIDQNYQPVPVNPLRKGRYNVRVSVGPNYSTRRQEAADGMLNFVQSFPQAGAVAGDLIAKAMDWPDAEKIADRLEKTLPPQFRSMEDLTPEEQQQMQAAMQQEQAAQMAQAQQQEVEMRKAGAEAVEAEADAEKARAEAMEANLELAAKDGSLNAAISQIVQQEVARAIQQMASQQGYAPTY